MRLVGDLSEMSGPRISAWTRACAASGCAARIRSARAVFEVADDGEPAAIVARVQAKLAEVPAAAPPAIAEDDFPGDEEPAPAPAAEAGEDQKARTGGSEETPRSARTRCRNRSSRAPPPISRTISPATTMHHHRRQRRRRARTRWKPGGRHASDVPPPPPPPTPRRPSRRFPASSRRSKRGRRRAQGDWALWAILAMLLLLAGIAAASWWRIDRSITLPTRKIAFRPPASFTINANLPRPRPRSRSFHRDFPTARATGISLPRRVERRP